MYWDWKPYVSAAQRKANAAKFAKAQAKKLGRSFQPISLQGNKISRTFWGNAWCNHLEKHCDYSNRLPRGRTYVRNGSVIDLLIQRSKVTAFVSGSEIYEIEIQIDKLKPAAWKKLCEDCSSSIDSLLDLLQGKVADGVMKRLTHPTEGMFPQKREIKMSCSCPDGAWMCKHIAAVLYGVGSRLDSKPELLFTLRGVDQLDLVAAAAANENLSQSLQGDEANVLAGSDPGEIFGIELAGEKQENASTAKPSAKKPSRAKSAKKAPLAKRSAVDKLAVKKSAPKSQPKRSSAKTAAAKSPRGSRVKLAAPIAAVATKSPAKPTRRAAKAVRRTAK